MLAGLFAVPAQAMCTAGSPPIVAGLQTAISDDPARALRTIETRLAQPGLNRIDRAWLLATQALAYSTLENSAEEIRAAEAGLKLAPDPVDAPHIELLAQLAFAQSDPAVLATLLDRIKAARAHVKPGSIADICSRAIVGSVTSDPVEGAREMGTAYRMAMQAGLEEQRAMIAIDLALLLMKGGDFAEARALVAEGAAFAQRHGLKFLKASTAMRAGTILVAQKDFAGTLPYFAEAFRISRSIGNTRFAAFAAQSACQSYISLNQFRRAEAMCDAAVRLFGGETIAAARMLSYRGRIAVGLKRYDEAVSLLTQQINGAASIATSPAKPFLHRARAYAGLGKWREATADYAEYIKRFEKETEALKSRDAATLRTQIEVDRQVDRNKALAREVAFEQERASYARQRTWAIATGAALLIAMLALFLWLGSRHRRALQRLATSDGLTGLANRRHATEQGTTALARATDARTPFSLALIDVDHFKKINDTHGHATGDEVLRNLAMVLKGTVRQSDIVARWGGEEFLVILPGLDALEAVAVTDRVRAAAAALDFPLYFSAGVAGAAPGERDLETMVARADAALYEAKRAGRNRSVIASDPTGTGDDRRGAGEAPAVAQVVNG
ncbi:diguanylate cyclase [Sphingomonas sp. VNH70]|uniref:GGDEF domain-containing protein n=1 Tax=Sphingomonas silueang TaxID=3156617 RepID=UPI0032B5EEBC